MACRAVKIDRAAASFRVKSPAYYFLPASGIGCAGFGPGTAGVVESPGRTGAGVMVSGLVVGVGGADLSRLQADNDNEARTMQAQSVRRVMGNLEAHWDEWKHQFFHGPGGDNVS